MIDNIKWLGHGSFLIQNAATIYINPWKINQQMPPADIILIGHDHYDHFSMADIEKLKTPDTQILCNQVVATQLNGGTVLRPWQSITLGDASIKTIPAYSITNSVHPKEHGGLGFIISINHYDIYYAGDTQLIPEMNLIRPDIAILPIDNNGTLTVADAVKATEILQPTWVIPSNWGKQLYGASPLDVVRFSNAIKANNKTKVVVPFGENANNA